MLTSEEKENYELELLNRGEEISQEIMKTRRQILALEFLLYTRWPLGKRKKPSELKAARIELRQKIFYLKQIIEDHSSVYEKFIESLKSDLPTSIIP